MRARLSSSQRCFAATWGRASAGWGVRAARFAPARRGPEHRRHARKVEFGPRFEEPRLYPLARERALDEHHLARVARDAAARGIERIDLKNHSRAAGIRASAACLGFSST